MSASRTVRVLILGGGHAGSSAARRLREAAISGINLEVAVVSRDNALVWHGLMPQVVSGILQPQDALDPLRALLRGVTIYPYEINCIRLDEGEVILNRGSERGDFHVAYDYLVFALGSVTELSRFPGLAEHSLPVKTMGDAFHLRNHVIDMLELASVEQNPEERRGMLTFVVAGAGFAGVEVCAEINGFIRDTLSLYPSIRREEIRVMLLSHSARILGPIGEELAERARRHLERCGIEVRVSTGVAGATSTSVILDSGERIPTQTLVSTVGIGPSPVLKELPIEMNRGRVQCDEFGRVQGRPGVYAAGDCAAIPNPETGRPFPPTLVAAHAQGEQIAENILAELTGAALRRGPGEHMQIALLDKAYGLFQSGPVKLDGFLASLIWRVVFLRYIGSRYRRLALVLRWLLTSIFPREATSIRVSRSDTILPMRFGDRDVIIRQGEPGSRFYIIRSGEVEVYRDDGSGVSQTVAHLGPGQFFGEVALLRHAARMASVRALGDVEVLAIDRSDFATLVQNLSGVQETIESTAAARAPR